MTKVIGMLVALAMFCAMPAVAFAQDSDDDTVSSGNTQTGTQTATGVGGDANGGDAAGGGGGSGEGDDGSGGSGGDAAGGDGGQGGDVGIQQGLCQQNAGGDADCEINQSQSFGGDSSIGGGGDSDGGHVSSGRTGSDHDGVVSVRNVRLARTGFDAWVFALVGGVSLAGGLGLLVAQRRGKLNG